jgi:hypothetical protein
MNKFEEEIEKRYGSFELSHDKNKLITDDIKSFTADVAIKFAEWLRLRTESDLTTKGCYEDEYVIINPDSFNYQFIELEKISTTNLFDYFINNPYGK